MQIGKKEITTHNGTVVLDVAPFVINNRVMVPMRAIAQAYDCEVEWDSSNRIVYIDFEKYEMMENIEYLEGYNKIENYPIREIDNFYSFLP